MCLFINLGMKFEQQIYFDDFSNLLLFFVVWEHIFPLSGLYCTMVYNLKHICGNQNASRTYMI